MLVSKMLVIEYNIQMLFQKLVSIENLASKSGDFLTKPTSISFVSNFVGLDDLRTFDFMAFQYRKQQC